MSLSRIAHLGWRFLVFWALQATSLLAMTALVPGIGFSALDVSTRAIAAAQAALLLGVVNFAIRPLIMKFTLPFSVITLGLFSLVVNALMLGLTAWLLPLFTVSGLGAALVGVVVLALVNTFLIRMLGIDDDDSFFIDLMDRWNQGNGNAQMDNTTRGLVMLEIDGLSFERMQRAIDQGYMPAIKKKLVDSGSHTLSRFDCGLPSQTSACQAGILYGNSDDIPAFRWFDRAQGKMWVSNNFVDAAALDSRLSAGGGLLRHGSSVNNLVSGQAQTAFFTMSKIRGHVAEGTGMNSNQLYWLYLNPNIFARALGLSIVDLFVELFQGLRQAAQNAQPRVSRLHKGYPFMRALTNVFLRDLSMYLVGLDVVRGAPAIYTTFVGYDEVAHYAGPDTTDALGTLRGFDRRASRVLKLIETKAPRPYDLILLSDHGQSVGWTFSQRCGKTLGRLIEDLAAPGSVVAEERSAMEADGYSQLTTSQLRQMREMSRLGRMSSKALDGAQEYLRRALPKRPAAALPPDPAITVCASGNFANVYFSRSGEKLTLTQINKLHPGLVDALVKHEHIGFVVALDEDKHPIAIGAHGGRDLLTGMVTGTDPLAAFGDVPMRESQLLRVAQFPSAGDLILNSAIYPDGQVASFEEMVGSHGGMGGQQTHAFILHPADMRIGEIHNAAELFPILNARRG